MINLLDQEMRLIFDVIYSSILLFIFISNTNIYNDLHMLNTRLTTSCSLEQFPRFKIIRTILSNMHVIIEFTHFIVE